MGIRGRDFHTLESIASELAELQEAYKLLEHIHIFEDAKLSTDTRIKLDRIFKHDDSE